MTGNINDLQKGGQMRMKGMIKFFFVEYTTCHSYMHILPPPWLVLSCRRREYTSRGSLLLVPQLWNIFHSCGCAITMCMLLFFWVIHRVLYRFYVVYIWLIKEHWYTYSYTEVLGVVTFEMSKFLIIKMFDKVILLCTYIVHYLWL